MLLQDGVEVGLEEAAEPMLGNDDVPGFRRECADDLGVPGVPDQDAALGAVRRFHPLPDADRQVPDTVRRLGAARVRQIGFELHLEVHDLHARLTRRCQDARRRLDSRLDAGDGNSRPREHAAFGTEVVLHVDDDHGGLRRLELERARARVDEERAASLCHDRRHSHGTVPRASREAGRVRAAAGLCAHVVFQQSRQGWVRPPDATVMR